MFRSQPDALPVGLWVVAVLGATTLMISPITPWLVALETVGLTTCVLAALALALWFVRR